ncbi:MAG: YidH family protein [Acidobacteriaceae bacterium]
MKPVTILGIVLILLGIVGFALGGISFTHEKKVVDMGPVQISHQQTKTVPIPPVLSAIALVGGIGLAVIGTRSK